MFKKILINISLVIISIIVSVIVIDLLARIVYDKKILIRPALIFRKTWAVDERLARYDPNISYSGKTISGLALRNFGNGGIERNIEFSTDSNGFRNYNDALQRNNDLIVVGDSFGAGSDSSQKDMLCFQLERKFGYNCYNISIPNYSPWQEFMTLKYEYKNIPKTENAIILWLLFSGNDFDEEYYNNYNLAPNSIMKKFLVKVHIYYYRSPIKRTLSRFIQKYNRESIARNYIDYKRKTNSNIMEKHHRGKTILFYRPYIKTTNRTMNQIKRHNNYYHFIDVFNKMNSFSKANNHKLAVVLIPAKEEIYKWLLKNEKPLSTHYEPTAFEQLISQLVNLEDSYFFDLKPILLQESKELYQKQGKYSFWEDGTHWNNYGQEIAAKAISNFLKSIQQSPE